LSLALGVSGLQLQRLVLDHTVLGDKGASTLAAGIHCCSSLQQLSLRYCSIGPAGAQQLADALMPASTKHASFAGPAADQLRISSPGLAGAGRPAGSCSNAVPCSSDVTNTPGSTGSAPSLHGLHLDGNPLTAAGLHAISKALKAMASIKILSLADIGLDCQVERDAQEVQVLAHSVLSGPNQLAELDFSDTFIS
jgi:Ran GTPase-activating protein (RanGAP) involved in mRNA processing and transport